MENEQEIITELMQTTEISREHAEYIVRKSGVLNETNWGAWITDIVRVVYAMTQKG